MKSDTTRVGGDVLTEVTEAISSFRAAHGKWPKSLTMDSSKIARLVVTHLTPKGWAQLAKKLSIRAGQGLAVSGANGVFYDYVANGPHKAAASHDAMAWLGIDPPPVAPAASIQAALNKPLYPACRVLPTVLGAQDSYINLAEVALRVVDGLTNAGSAGTELGNVLAKHVEVITGFEPWREARHNGHVYAIAQVATIADSFLRRFGREYAGYKNVSWKMRGGNGDQLDALSAISENVTAAEKAAIVASPEYQLIQYFWDVRNAAIHQIPGTLLEEHTALTKSHGDQLKRKYGHAPNTYPNIAYSDFMLLTRAVKAFGRLLNETCALTPKEILQFHLARNQTKPSSKVTGPADGPWINAIRLTKGSEAKERSLLDRFRLQYQLDEADVNALRAELKLFYATDPSKKVRRRSKPKART